MFLVLITVLDASEIAFLVFGCLFYKRAAGDEFKDRCVEFAGWDARELILSFVSLSMLFATLTTIGITNLIILNVWLRQCKHMTTYEYIILQRKAAAKYKEQQNNSDSGVENQEHLSMSQVPLVRSTTRARHGPIVPDAPAGLIHDVLTERRTLEDIKTTAVSPDGNAEKLS